MQAIIAFFFTELAILMFIIVIYFAIIAMFYKKPKQGQAIVRTGFGGAKVATDRGLYVLPVVHHLETLDISVKKIKIECMGIESLICKNDSRADVKAAFFIRVNNEVEYIKKVVQTIGASKASRIETLEELFVPKFSEALKTLARKFEFNELLDSRREFRDEVIDLIGSDLNGFTLEDCAIDYLEKSNGST